MFFGKNKKKETKLELLRMDNIFLNCKPMEKEKVIRTIGQALCDSGYVEEDYIEGMLKREESFATNIGNGIALPHGVEAAKAKVKQSGIAVMTFPEGTDWNGEKVKLVIAVAGAGDEHLDILMNIATNLSTPEAVDKMVESDKQYIYDVFVNGNK